MTRHILCGLRIDEWLDVEMWLRERLADSGGSLVEMAERVMQQAEDRVAIRLSRVESPIKPQQVPPVLDAGTLCAMLGASKPSGLLYRIEAIEKRLASMDGQGAA